ncbi:hypothetical protein TBLA_0C04660 [Henningerozyma blattae CBS 6284]|uniref:Isocitrate lyase n=1 Tax=Henningerozyma blattae (strain ATCC 34711 / CBS 6284 / DSM 70876 / NBRC 10599 / NRRL Y-10934 / UCD 77-7) TaxID=1071380 RepID=I2H1L0_HENB6|nr:hypothetical protein TBLA_0C04660 [Tetrapisispora blattae CBS 6284]CCH60262.1 hypothetical protein TBLA_0C04660 [Tetrapisispora blattae CBS 6284]
MPVATNQTKPKESVTSHEDVIAKIKQTNAAAAASKTDTSLNEFEKLQNSLLEESKRIEKWWQEPRWKGIQRPYSAMDIAKKRGNFPETIKYPSSVMSEKLFKTLEKHFEDKTVSMTFGAMDPVQITQMAKYLDTIYVSGWQCSSTASTSNEPGPDLADYPMDTVPNKVEHLFKAQQFHNRRQYEERSNATSLEELEKMGPEIDYLTPIVADADAGHGGLTAVFKLTKMFIERGAAGIHMEDQTSTNKKCGHMSGRCVIPVQEHINRLVTIRMCSDIMNSSLIIVARTDSEEATLLSSTIDKRDHYFIIGATNEKILEDEGTFVEFMDECIANKDDLQAKETYWNDKAGLKLFNEAFADAVEKDDNIKDKQNIIDEFNAKVGPYDGKSIYEMQAICKQLIGHTIFFDWDICRVREGLYRYKGGTKCSIMRAREFSKYADLVWMESNLPDYEQAREFAEGIHDLNPNKWMAYNLSPSFNWNKAMSIDDQETFIKRLGLLGYNWQFITLAGLHTTALAIDQFSKNFIKHGMKSYAQDIQQQEIAQGVDIVKHQKWSGAEYIDGILRLAQGGVSATAAMGQGVTETQFQAER